MKRWEKSQWVMGVAGLIAIILWLGSSVFYYRTALIDAEVLRLAAQGEVIAGAIGRSAAGESQVARVDPTRVLPRRNGQSLEAHGDDPTLNALSSVPAIAPRRITMNR